jgi:carbamate kinase
MDVRKQILYKGRPSSKFKFGLYHFFCSGVISLFILTGSGGIPVIWTHSSIFFFISISKDDISGNTSSSYKIKWNLHKTWVSSIMVSFWPSCIIHFENTEMRFYSIFILTGSGGIPVIWTHSSIFFFISISKDDISGRINYYPCC